MRTVLIALLCAAMIAALSGCAGKADKAATDRPKFSDMAEPPQAPAEGEPLAEAADLVPI